MYNLIEKKGEKPGREAHLENCVFGPGEPGPSRWGSFSGTLTNQEQPESIARTPPCSSRSPKQQPLFFHQTSGPQPKTSRCRHRSISPHLFSLPSIRQGDAMLRHTLARSTWRTGKQAVNASRAFSATAQRPAEVELTIGNSSFLPKPLVAIAVLTVHKMERRFR